MVTGLSFVVFFIGILVLIVVVAYGISIYNGLVRLRNQYEKAWSDIDVLLKQRVDLVPNLVETCKGYVRHERGTLEAVAGARSQWQQAGTTGERMAAAGQLSGALKSLFAVVESYPDLKASANFLELQGNLGRIENQIADRREFYNDSVNLFNTAAQQFPDIMVARLFGWQEALFFRTEEAERAAPQVSYA